MSIKEVFPNPTVKQVIFQIVFPDLFYIENKIGDFQLRIMDRFPESSLLYRTKLLFVDKGPEFRAEDIQKDTEKETRSKIWQFKSEKDFKLNVTQNSFDISSRYHKTYNLPESDKFRDIIEFVLNEFFKILSIPVIKRIGLRYIDECPIPSKDNETFSSYYDSKLPIDHFNLVDAEEMEFKALIKRGDFFLRYGESLKKSENKYVLVLDFDGSAINIDSADCLKITDRLHDLILDEYERTIKKPVYDFMRTKKEIDDESEHQES